MEDARTEDAQDTCAGHLEDALFKANEKVEALVEMADKLVQRLKLARNPCGVFEKMFRSDRCKIE